MPNVDDRKQNQKFLNNSKQWKVKEIKNSKRLINVN